MSLVRAMVATLVAVGLVASLAGCSSGKPAAGGALARETPAIQKASRGAADALADGDADALAEQCAPEVREQFRAMINDNPGVSFAALAAALRTASPTTVSDPPDGVDPQQRQFAEVSFVLDGETFYAQLEKTGDAWQFVVL